MWLLILGVALAEHLVVGPPVADVAGRWEVRDALGRSFWCARREAPLAEPRNVSAAAVRGCADVSTGWWAYRVCLGDGAEIRQVHAEGGRVVAANSIGRAAAVEVRADAVIARYEGGAPCDLHGRERSAEVRVRCNPDVALRVVAVREPRTCEYVFEAEARDVCRGDSWGATVECARAAADGGDDGAERLFMARSKARVAKPMEVR